MHSRAEGVVWLWQAHNTVNLRLAAEEAADAGGNLYKYDPAFPKAAWPPPELCAACLAAAEPVITCRYRSDRAQ